MAEISVAANLGQPGIALKLHLKILESPQKAALRKIASFATAHGFYLAGGTAVALQLGHRKSEDLDWFTPNTLAEPQSLLSELNAAGIAFDFRNEGRGALHGTLSGVRVSFLHYKYQILMPPTKADGGFEIASLDDLAAIKLSTILQRGTRKDFVDIYALGREHANLQTMLDLYKQKFNAKDWRLVLHALTYTVDAENEPMPKMIWKVQWAEIVRGIRAMISEWEKSHG